MLFELNVISSEFSKPIPTLILENFACGSCNVHKTKEFDWESLSLWVSIELKVLML